MPSPAEAPPARAYDLVLVSSVDPPQRVRRAVFLTDADPLVPRPIRVVQISDLHLGKSREIQANLEDVIRDVNAISPDLVVVTGDLADQGRTMALEQQAADVLLRVDAPVLVILGNHDYGHFPTLRRADETDQGFYHFARAFHPFRWTHLSFAGWDFIGFDSGPSLFSPRILTRGVLPETLERIQGAIDAADRDHRRGVVLFSHAPTRAVVGSDPDHTDSDGVGSMFYGAKGLEEILLLADKRKERVIHLSGHTHWSDVFEPGQADFDRWPWNQLTCPRALRGGVAMINAPSATHITFPTIDHGRRSGFVEILLDDRDTRVVFHLRDRAGNPVRCESH
jgi:Icc-related predicted phosphoesterase